MKEHFSVFVVMLLCAAPSGLEAQFAYTSTNGSTSTTGYNGPGGAVILPSTLNGLPVTSIAVGAFSGCSNLSSIAIPSTITQIADAAFLSCTTMRAVYFEGNAPDLGSSVFPQGNNSVAYYLPGTAGWSAMFGNLPTVLWSPVIQANVSGFGVGTNGFGFAVTGTTNIPVVLEACTNLVNPSWTAVDSSALVAGVYYFSDPGWTNCSSRFYRIQWPWGLRSTARSNDYTANVVGFANVNVVGGGTKGLFQMIANPLKSVDNTIGALLANAPDSTTFYKFNGISFDIATALQGWEQPEYTLDPGEGAIVCSPKPWTITFVGEVLRGSLTNPYPALYSIRASQVPQAGTLTDLGLSGNQLSDGDTVIQFNTTSQTFDFYTWLFGEWLPSEPILGVGESVWLQVQNSGDWNRAFSVQ